jgi:hypothetical protein
MTLEPLTAVDFPKEADRLNCGCYAVRIHAPESAQRVEVAFNQGKWRPCLKRNGFWWFDWTIRWPGEHEIAARAVWPDGSHSHSAPIHCYVP